MTTIAEIKQTMQHKMDQTIANFKTTLTHIRTGRANPGLLDTVHVDYYGSSVPISQVANVSLLDARTISVQPWEKGMGAKIEKAIRESDLGLNPMTQGNLIRVPLPALTEERRKELVKVIHKLAEEGRVAVRHARGDAMTKVKKLSGLPKDDVTRAEKEIQKFTDEHIKQIDTLIQQKEQELLQV